MNIDPVSTVDNVLLNALLNQMFKWLAFSNYVVSAKGFFSNNICIFEYI